MAGTAGRLTALKVEKLKGKTGMHHARRCVMGSALHAQWQGAGDGIRSACALWPCRCPCEGAGRTKAAASRHRQGGIAMQAKRAVG
jgi:hypothetical protein